MTKARKSDSHAARQSTLAPRQRILETAQRLFYREGIRSTGIDRIIAEAGVTKVTVYRHFPSKDVLIEAFLETRHDTWTANFRAMLDKYRDAQSPRERKAAPLYPLYKAVCDIIHETTFRGCAFANTVAEMGPTLPVVLEIARRHKDEMRDAIAALLPEGKSSTRIAQAATLAMDGTIVNAQTGGQAATDALAGLKTMLDALNRDVSG